MSSPNMSEVTVSAEELHVLDHTTAWRRGRYRNHFTAGDDHADWPVLVGLVAKGLMSFRGSNELLGGMSTFVVTDAGFAFLRKALP